jgi:hypothetical protein
MYAIIRHYRTEAGSIDAMAHRVDREFADRIPEEVGSVLYTAIDTGDGTAMTITLFENEEAGLHSEAAVARVREALAEFQVEEIDVFRGEVMVSRASEKVLKPIHQRASTE